MAEAGGRGDRGRRVAARDLDRQGRHRGAEPGHAASSRRSSSRRARRSRSGRSSRVIAPEGAGAPRRAERAARARDRRRPPTPRSRGRERAAEPTPRRAAPRPPAAPPPAARTADGAGGTARRSSRPSSRGSPPSTASTSSRVPGTGRGGRVTKKDILGFIERRRAAPHRRPRRAPPRRGPGRSARPAADPSARTRRRRPAAAGRRPSRQGEPLEPMTAMRKGIAEHMRRSLDTSAHVTSAIEVDMSQVVAIRAKLKKEYQSSVRRQPDLPHLRRARGRRHAARVPVDQRRDPRRPDRHAQLRQPRLRGRARGRQGPDRPGRQERRGPQPARDGARGHRHRRARARQAAAAGRRAGRHVHDHEPRRLRHLPRNAGDQPAAGRRSSARTRSSSGRGSSRTSSART